MPPKKAEALPNLNRLARVLWQTLRSGAPKEIQLHAQALSFDTLLAIVPTATALVAIAQAAHVMAPKQQATILRHWIEQIAASPNMADAVWRFIEQATTKVDSGHIGGISILILAISAISMLRHMDYAFSQIFLVRKRRALWHQILLYGAVLAGGPLLLALSFAGTAALQTPLLHRFIAELQGGIAWLMTTLPALLTWIAFAIMYRGLPRKAVSWRNALIAGAIAGGTWHGAKQAYAKYAASALTVHDLYGSVATVPLFFLWVYVSWLILLYGALLARNLQEAKQDLS